MIFFPLRTLIKFFNNLFFLLKNSMFLTLTSILSQVACVLKAVLIFWHSVVHSNLHKNRSFLFTLPEIQLAFLNVKFSCFLLTVEIS